MQSKIIIIFFLITLFSCDSFDKNDSKVFFSKNIEYKKYNPVNTDISISRSDYYDKLYGFWLGQCIANWTGLTTEMDKIGNIGNIKTGNFYTREDWGGIDQPNIWSIDSFVIDSTKKIDFVFKNENEIWGSDDDTDIEYMYQYLTINNSNVLSSNQIKEGWLNHIKHEEENYLWVSNQKAFDLMKKGILPPNTSDINLNEHYEMIDAQLTTEIFGLYSPTREDFALKMSYLPIRTTARDNAAWISEFYVIMHSLASKVDKNLSLKDQIMWLSQQARKILPKDSYSSKMYDFVKNKYESNITWEQTRDSIYYRYQVNQKDGYDITSKELNCNGCFAAGINFASSLVSLFYGEGDFKKTIKIGTLSGWDSDNPTSTWGGLLGFMNGKKNIEKIFNRNFSNKYNIHRTRRNFPNNGIDTFENMALQGVFIVDKIVQSELGGGVDKLKNTWWIPQVKLNNSKL